jgi:CheY-like chemotaxis protein
LSLTGNLEDLPLLDILQIVSFSKRTGTLGIHVVLGEAGIVFRDGFVVAAFTWDSMPIDRRFAALPEETRAGVIRTRIEIALEQLIRLREGLFDFTLTDEPAPSVGGRDISLETLAVGLNAQELLLDLARGIDEDRRDSTAAVEASFAEPDAAERLGDRDSGRMAAPVRNLAPPGSGESGDATVPVKAVPLLAHLLSPPAPARPVATAAPPAVESPTEPPAAPGAPAAASAGAPRILLVDDEEDVRRLLASLFREGGYEVVEAEDPEAAVKKGGRLGKEGIPFLLVTDLGMPTSGGSSFQGGFEIVKRLWKMNLRPPVLMMTESLSPSLQLRAKQMGIGSLLFKPGLSKLSPRQFEADLLAFANKILMDVLPRIAPSPAAPKPGRRAKGLPPGPAEPEPASAEEMSRQFTILQRRLSDLRQPSDANQIAILVMKVAREFFERAILFLVKNEQVRGLGGFGTAPKRQSVNLLAREVVVPIGEPSVFRDAVSSAKPFLGPLPPGKWSSYLMGKIGRFQSNAVSLMPLVTHREAIAVLFGDNPETGREFGRLDALEVFVNQAGVALENAFLQRKIQALEAKPHLAPPGVQ